MKEIHQKYIECFNKYGLPLLTDFGFRIEISTDDESTDILISHDHFKSHLLTFSTNRLDYDHGVIICESPDRKLNWDKIVLPNNIELNNGRIYRFMGSEIENEVVRLIQDFKYHLNLGNSLGGKPFVYCSQNSRMLGLSCDYNKLIHLQTKELKRESSEQFAYRNTKEDFYKCSDCNGYWKSAKDIYEREIWLKIGEISDHKYFDKNQQDYNSNGLNSFPLTFFNISEAIENGLDLECGRLHKIDNFHGLSCAPKNLNNIKEISFIEAIGNHIKIDIFQCDKCLTYYKIREEYDSHHGVNKICIRINEKKELLFGEIFEFKETELSENNIEKITVANSTLPKAGRSWWQKLFGSE